MVTTLAVTGTSLNPTPLNPGAVTRISVTNSGTVDVFLATSGKMIAPGETIKLTVGSRMGFYVGGVPGQITYSAVVDPDPGLEPAPYAPVVVARGPWIASQTTTPGTDVWLEPTTLRPITPAAGVTNTGATYSSANFVTANSAPGSVVPLLAGKRERPGLVPSVITSTGAPYYGTFVGSGSPGNTQRSSVLTAVAATDIRVGIPNWWWNNSGSGSEVLLPNSMNYKVAIEYAGVIYPLTFNESTRTITLDPPGTVFSDPLGIDVPAGATLSLRVLGVSVGTGASAPKCSGGGPGVTTTGDGYTSGDVVDSGSITNGIAFLWTPPLVCGTWTDWSAFREFLGIGDSIMAGIGEAGLNFGSGGAWSWFTRGINNTVPALRVAGGSDSLVNWAAPGQQRALRSAWIKGRTHAVNNLGTNDVFGVGSIAPQTLTQVQTNETALVAFLKARGVQKYYTSTILPRTASTDKWETVGNQTVRGQESVRLSVNAWRRTTPAILDGPVIELANAVETAQNSGFWLPAGRVVTDGAMSSSTNPTNLTSATANFTSADVGEAVLVPGAGASGADLQATISSVTNSTTAVLNVAASTTVSAARTLIKVYTYDGIHPTASGHKLLGAVFAAALPSLV